MIAPIYKEWFILSSIIFQRLSNGLVQGLPAILTPVITSDASDIRVTKEEASWITAICPLLGVIGYLYLPYLMQKFGRRFTYAYVNIISLAGTIIIASAANYTWLLVGRAIEGTIFCNSIIIFMIAAEYCHPKRRGLVITMTIISNVCGVTLCHGLSAVLTWRQICWLFTIPPIIALVSTTLWPESPSWLAYKGRYQECENAFRWFRDVDSESNKELEELIIAQREIRQMKQSNRSVKNTLKSLGSKEFLKPIFIVMIGVCFVEASGAHYMTSYLLEIMTELTGNKSNDSLYFCLGVDLIKILAIVLSTKLVKVLKRRILLALSGTVSIVVLIFTCLFDYLQESNVLVLPWLPATLLILYYFVLSFTFPVVAIVEGEIFPMKYKGIGLNVIGVLQALLIAFVMKLTSNMLASMQTYGTFFVYVILMAGTLALYIFILPETKDRTLQNIENEILDLKLPNKDELDVEMLTK